MSRDKKKNLRVFLSYSMEDKASGNRVKNLLSRRPNVRIFTNEMLSAGEDWQSKLKEELSNSDLFLVMLSPNSFASSLVLQEIGAAWGTNKPILVSGTNIDLLSRIPVSIKKSQFINLDELAEPEKLDKILEPFEKMESADA